MDLQFHALLPKPNENQNVISSCHYVRMDDVLSCPVMSCPVRNLMAQGFVLRSITYFFMKIGAAAALLVLFRALELSAYNLQSNFHIFRLCLIDSISPLSCHYVDNPSFLFMVMQHPCGKTHPFASVEK